MMADLVIGQRVLKERDGQVGHVESVDDDFTDVRWLTPHNKPSCCVGMCWTKDLIPVPDSVIAQPRSEEWWEESRRFCAAIEGAVTQMFNEEAPNG